MALRAPLLYVWATQVNAIVPYEVAGCTQGQAASPVSGGVSPDTTLPFATAAPGILTSNASGAGPAAASQLDGTFNGPSSPGRGRCGWAGRASDRIQ